VPNIVVARKSPSPTALRCPYCGTPCRIIETRKVGRGIYVAIRRRRGCPRCSHRFTTYELPEDAGAKPIGSRFPSVARALQLVADLRRVIGELGEDR
jgi:hypothetical protein